MSPDLIAADHTHTRALIEDLEHSTWRELLRLQFDPDPKAQYRHHTTLRTALDAAERMGIMTSDLAPNLHDCSLLLEIGMTGTFPAKDSWSHAGLSILFSFWKLRHASFAPLIEKHFDVAHDAARAAALVIVCIQEDAEALETLVRLIDRHGLQRATHPRLFSELTRRHTGNARRLLPALLMKAGDPDNVSGVMNFINVALEQGHLEAKALLPANEFVRSEAARLLQLAESQQQADGKRWRHEENYLAVRVPLGVYLDLLGILPGEPSELLQRALQLNDPLPVFFASLALLKKGVEPASTAWQKCAASLETRADLYTQLKQRNRLELFPQTFLTFDAFAASAMTQWLLYPAELGYEPASLELIAKVTGTTEEGHDAVMCLWKCILEDGGAISCASGPYSVGVELGPLWGGDTFSNFTDWDQATPDEHLKEILGTLRNWRVVWCDGHGSGGS